MTLSAVAVNCYVDWNNDADFSDANENVSTYLLNASTRRGRSSVNDEFTAGSMTVELNNASGLFSPFDSGGALYGSLLPGRAIKLEAVHSAVTYPVFYGYIQSYQQSRTPDGRPSVTIQAYDAFDILRFGKIRTPLYENQDAGSLIDSILDVAGWSASLRDLDTGVSTIPFFWWEQGDPLSAIRAAAKQDLGGQLYMSRDGKVTFRNRYARSSVASSGTLTGMQALAFEARRDDLVDSVQFTRAGLSLAADTLVLYTMTPRGYEVRPGITDQRNTILGQFSGGAKAVVTPVATTDYTVNTQQDETGTDATAQLTVSSFTAFGGGFEIVLNDLDSQSLYVQKFQVRGQPIRRSNDSRIIEAQSTSPIISGQTLSQSFDYNDDVGEISGYASNRAQVFSTLQPRPMLSIIPKDDTVMALMLGAELGSRWTITNTTGLYPTQINADFYLENIALNFAGDLSKSATWGLFSKPQGGGGLFRISGASGGGQDYSAIASATPTTEDRIAY